MNPYSYSLKPQPDVKMSSTTETTADTSGDKNEEKKETSDSTSSTTTTTTITNNKQADNKSMKKVRSKKDLKNDPSRFEIPGVNFNAKLIGIDEVTSARGDKMCQESLQRLKLAVKSSGQHKQKIIVNVSLEGVRLIDLKSQATNHTHLVHRISFISRDITDSRAFGYVYGAGEGKHKFFAIKTEKAAEALVLTLRDLFQAVYEMKKKEVEEAKQKQEETVETAEEAKDNQEPVYQVPKNGAPVENKEDPTYQVPTNNAPVNKNEENLLSLENELESIGKGIEQMNDMEDMFSDLRSPATTSQSSSAWGAELADTMAQPPAATQPAFSVGGSPFPAGTTSGPPGGSPIFGQPFPATGQVPGGFGGQPWGPAGAQPGMAPGGFPAATPNPFGTPNVPPRTGMGLPPPPGHPTHHSHHPHPGGFPPTPFPGPGQINKPNFPAGPQPSAAAAGPGPAPASDPFGNDPFAMGDSGGFGDNLLTPDKIEVPQEEEVKGPPKKKDAFEDLTDIGAKDKSHKSPKQMFTELAAPPKKSLNELKVENNPAPKPASPVGFQASEVSEGAKPGSSPLPADFKALDQFGNLDPFGSEDPFGSSDPFADSFPSTSVNPSQNQEALAPKMEPKAQNGTNSFSASSQNALFDDSFLDDFSLPVPKGPPPPLPTNIDSVSTKLPNIPPPPPRHNITTPSNTQHTPPLPPRPKSRSVSHSNSQSSTDSEVVIGLETPPLPPRPLLENQSSNKITVPNDSLSEVLYNNKDGNNKDLNSKDSETNIERASSCDLDKAKERKEDITQNILNKTVLIEQSSNEQEMTVENCGNKNSAETFFYISDFAHIEEEKCKVIQTDHTETISSLSVNSDVSDQNLKNHINDQSFENLNNNKNIQNLSNSDKNLSINEGSSSDNGAPNCDTIRISDNNNSSSQKETTSDKVKTDSGVGDKVDHNLSRTSAASITDPFVSVDPFASDDPFAQSDPFSSDPFASDPFSDSVSTTSVSSTSSNDPFTSALTSQKSSSASVDAGDDPFSIFDNTFEPFHFEKSKKSKVKLKVQEAE